MVKLTVQQRPHTPFALLSASCQYTEPTLFTALDADDTYITFANTITETADQKVLQYEHTYNGGGVAVGDSKTMPFPT